MTQQRFEVELSAAAVQDIAEILKWSESEFGGAAALRYEDLIAQALIDIGLDPERAGTRARPELMIESVRTYHLSYSRRQTVGGKVKSPRHFLLYRRHSDGVIEVGRVLHDSRDLDRHLPEDFI